MGDPNPVTYCVAFLPGHRLFFCLALRKPSQSEDLIVNKHHSGLSILGLFTLRH